MSERRTTRVKSVIDDPPTLHLSIATLLCISIRGLRAHSEVDITVGWALHRRKGKDMHHFLTQEWHGSRDDYFQLEQGQLFFYPPIFRDYLDPTERWPNKLFLPYEQHRHICLQCQTGHQKCVIEMLRENGFLTTSVWTGSALAASCTNFSVA